MPELYYADNLRHTLELALLASSSEKLNQVFFHSRYLIELNRNEKRIREPEANFLEIFIEAYYNKLRKFELIAREIDRSSIV